ncbi:hypothetical protein D3C84_1082410 [compost metagenome]
MAWCSLPMERARTSRSISPANTSLPLEVRYSLAGATKAILGVCWRVAASSGVLMSPMRRAPAMRICSKRASASGSPLIASRSSVP